MYNSLKRSVTKVKGWQRKAKWLLVWSCLYLLAAFYLIFFVEDGWYDYSGILQMIWVFCMSLPLWIRPIGDWVFKRNNKRGVP